MGTLFGRDFEDRAHLQQRQAYHQNLLDSARFGQPGASGEGVTEASRDPSAGGTGTWPTGLFGPVLGVLAVIFFAFTIPAAILSAGVALPVAWLLMSRSRALTGQSVDSYGGFYRSALFGVFAYLTATALILAVYAFLRAPHTHAGIVADFGAVLSPDALGFERGVPMLIPGLLACAAVWSTQIGRPFKGLKGYLQAIALASLVPALLAATAWMLSPLFR